VLVGARDEIVPAELSRRVYEAAVEPKRFVQVAAAHHNDEALLAGEELVAELVRFLDSVVRSSR
jgi:hypothetical protein